MTHRQTKGTDEEGTVAINSSSVYFSPDRETLEVCGGGVWSGTIKLSWVPACDSIVDLLGEQNQGLCWCLSSIELARQQPQSSLPTTNTHITLLACIKMGLEVHFCVGSDHPEGFWFEDGQPC